MKAHLEQCCSAWKYYCSSLICVLISVFPSIITFPFHVVVRQNFVILIDFCLSIPAQFSRDWIRIFAAAEIFKPLGFPSGHCQILHSERLPAKPSNLMCSFFMRAGLPQLRQPAFYNSYQDNKLDLIAPFYAFPEVLRSGYCLGQISLEKLRKCYGVAKIM